MIKNFDTYINEDYFSKLANRKDIGSVRKENELTEEIVREYVYDGYHNKIKSISIRKENGKQIVDIDGDFYLKSNVEEIPFQFGKVTGCFVCPNCELISLKGCPTEVGKSFNCAGCKNLTSLEGCPEVVGDFFYCNNCPKITSLKGCPKEVGKSFRCSDCGKRFTEDEVRKLCNVKKMIKIW